MTAHSKTIEDTLYSIIGLRDFASSTEIEAVYREFETSEQFAELRRGQFASGLENVFSVLLSPQTKQWYDLLLEAQLRNGGFLTPILDPVERNYIRDFAQQLGIALVQHSEYVLRILPEPVGNASDTADSAIRQLPVRVASIELVFYAFPCQAYSTYEFDTPRLALRWEQDLAIPFRSNRIRVVASDGDRVVLVCVGHDPRNEQFQAAYINQTRNVFSPLEHAETSMFSASRDEVAERLGIRARPESIRKAIRQYYAQLANAICHFEPETGQELVEVTCYRFAKTPLSTW